VLDYAAYKWDRYVISWSLSDQRAALEAAREWGRRHGDPPGRFTAWPNARDAAAGQPGADSRHV
jgi:hypothetical protein